MNKTEPIHDTAYFIPFTICVLYYVTGRANFGPPIHSSILYTQRHTHLSNFHVPGCRVILQVTLQLSLVWHNKRDKNKSKTQKLVHPWLHDSTSLRYSKCHCLQNHCLSLYSFFHDMYMDFSFFLCNHHPKGFLEDEFSFI